MRCRLRGMLLHIRTSSEYTVVGEAPAGQTMVSQPKFFHTVVITMVWGTKLYPPGNRWASRRRSG